VTLTRADPVLAVHDLELTAKGFVDVLGCTRADPEPGKPGAVGRWVCGHPMAIESC
jgi:hypothetical protein